MIMLRMRKTHPITLIRKQHVILEQLARDARCAVEFPFRNQYLFLEFHFQMLITLLGCGSSIKDKGNGDEGAVDEFPWHGSLFLEGKSECSSTLINNKYILTAAHCVYDLDDDEKSLLLVRFLIPNLHETNEKTIQRGVSDIRNHAEANLN